MPAVSVLPTKTASAAATAVCCAPLGAGGRFGSRRREDLEPDTVRIREEDIAGTRALTVRDHPVQRKVTARSVSAASTGRT